MAKFDNFPNEAGEGFTKGQMMARLNVYGPEYHFHPELVNFSKTADYLFNRRDEVKLNKELRIQCQAALSKLSSAIDWFIVVNKEVIHVDPV